MDPRDISELNSGVESQESICGSIQLAHNMMDFHQCGLSEYEFTGARRYLIQAFLAIEERGAPITGAAIAAELRRAGTLEAAGTMEYVGGLIDRATGIDTLAYDAKTLIGLASARRLAQVYDQAGARLLSGDPASEVVAYTNRETARINDRTTGPTLINADNRHDIRPAQSLVDGVLDLNQISTLYGPAGDGKSHVALDLALSVAQVGPVIFVGAEAVEDLPPRIDGWKARHNLPLSNFWIFPEPIRLAEPLSIHRFISAAVKLDPVLIIIDPLASCLPGLDENSTDSMTKVVDSLNAIRRATGAALLVVHHSGWNTDHERGSSVLRAASRTVTNVSKSDETIRVTVIKRNSGRFAVEKFFKVVEVDPGDIPNYDPNQAGRYTVLLPASRVASEFGPLTPKQLGALECLGLAVFHDGAKFADVVGHLGAAKSSVNYTLSALMKRGLIHNDKGTYTLTDTGRDIANSIVTEPQAQQNSGTELALNWYTNESLRRSVGSSVVTLAVQSSSVEFSVSSVEPVQVQFSPPPP